VTQEGNGQERNVKKARRRKEKKQKNEEMRRME
jgi:hypothetical protein